MRKNGLAMAMAMTMTLTACGGADVGNDVAPKPEEARQLDPNPPMSGADIDSIVKETRDRDAPRGGGAAAPPAENASGTTN